MSRGDTRSFVRRVIAAEVRDSEYVVKAELQFSHQIAVGCGGKKGSKLMGGFGQSSWEVRAPPCRN